MSIFAEIARDKSPEIILEGQRKDEFLETVASLFDASEPASLTRHKQNILRVRGIRSSSGIRTWHYDTASEQGECLWIA